MRLLILAAGFAEGQSVGLTYDSKPTNISLTLANAGAPPPSQSQDDLSGLISARCPIPDNDTADFVVRPDGQVISRRLRTLNESSTVLVTVVGDQSVLRQVKVARSSSIRVVSVATIYGQGTSLGQLTLNRQAEIKPTCDSTTFPLTDFAPGKAQFDVTVAGSNGANVVKSTIEFNVNAVYSGIFLLGGMRTTAQSPSFAKVYNGTDSVVSRSGSGSRFLYIAAYSPFVWGARDLTLSIPSSHWYQRVNPLIGVVLNDVTNGAVVGTSVDLSHQIFLIYGIHAAHVSELDPASGLHVGASATGYTTIPTVSHWTFKPFYGVAIDVQAATSLFKGLLGLGTTN